MVAAAAPLLTQHAAASLPTWFAAYENSLITNPVPTRIITAACTAFIGDALAQSRDGCEQYDTKRTAGFVTVEMTYRGLIQQGLLLWIIAHFDGRLLSLLLPTVNRTLLTSIERVLVLQFAAAPFIYYPIYFLVTGLVQGLDLPATLRRGRDHFKQVFGWNVCFWLPVQFAQFTFIPTQFKVPFICFASLLWSSILSMMAGSVVAWRTDGCVIAEPGARRMAGAQMEMEECKHHRWEKLWAWRRKIASAWRNVLF